MHLNHIINEPPSLQRPVVLPTVLPASNISLPPISDILSISQLPPVSALQQHPTTPSYQQKLQQRSSTSTSSVANVPVPPPVQPMSAPPPNQYALPSLTQQQIVMTPMPPMPPPALAAAAANNNYKYYYDYYPSDTSNLDRSPISHNGSPIFYTAQGGGTTIGIPSLQVQPIIRHNSYPCKDTHRRHTDDSDDGSLSPPPIKRKTRNNLPKEITFILLKWLNDHLNHPYPNSFEKNQLMMATGLNQQQLSNWFINARRRKIKSLKEQKRLNLV